MQAMTTVQTIMTAFGIELNVTPMVDLKNAALATRCWETGKYVWRQ